MKRPGSTTTSQTPNERIDALTERLEKLDRRVYEAQWVPALKATAREGRGFDGQTAYQPTVMFGLAVLWTGEPVTVGEIAKEKRAAGENYGYNAEGHYREAAEQRARANAVQFVADALAPLFAAATDGAA